MDHENRRSGDPSPPGARRSRRSFLQGSLIGGAAITAVASAGPASLLPAAGAQEGPSKFPSPDEKTIGAMQTFEKAAAQLYLSAMGKLTDQDVINTATTYMGHHNEQARALGEVLRQSESQSAKVLPNQSFLDTYQGPLTAAADQGGVLEVLLSMEEALAATYLESLQRLKVAFNAGAVSTILPVDAQHAVVLATLLDQPIDQVLPATTPTEGAIDLSSYSTQAAGTTTTTTTAPATTTTTLPGGPTP